MISNTLENRPLKTIVLFIFLHGTEPLQNELNIPISNSVVNPTGRLGLCAYSTDLYKENQTLNIFNYYRTLLQESKTINDFNYIMSNVYSNTKIYTPPDEAIKFKYNKNSDYFLKEYNISRDNPENYVRNYIYDKKYSFLNDAFNKTMGIYILGTKHVSNEINNVLTQPFIKFNKDSPASILNAYNIIDENVYFNLIYNFVTRFGFFDVENSNLSDVFDNTSGRNRFNNIFLSRVLRLFYNMGFEHVDIVEISCRRIEDEKYMTNYPLIRRHSISEKENYKNWSEKNINTGGKQSKKTKKNKNLIKRQPKKTKVKNKKTIKK